MKYHRLSIIVVPTLFVVGCQTPPTVKSDHTLQFSHTAPSQPTRQPLHRGALTRDEVVQNVMRSSPHLQGLLAEVRALEAEAHQTSLLPNPEFEFEAENFGGTGETDGFDSAEITGGLSQEIQLGRKRAKRTRVAQLKADSLQAELDSATLELRIASDQKFVTLLEAQSLGKLAQEDVRIANERLEAMRLQLDAEKISRLDVNKASIALSTAQQKLRRLESESAKAAADLSRLWGGDGTEIKTATGSLDSSLSAPSWAQVQAAVARHPAVTKTQIDLTTSEADLDLAKAQRIPNIRLGGGIRELRDSDDTAAVLSFSIPLPLFDRNQGGIRAAEERIQRAGSDRIGTKSNVSARYRRLHAEMMSARDRVKAFDAGIVAAARQSFEDMQSAYQEGKRDYLEYLDAQRTFFDTRRQQVEAKADYLRAKRAIEHLINYRPSSHHQK